jgi:hypothetical protein
LFPLTSQVLLDGVLLRALPAVAFSAPFYWLMGLRPTAAAYCTFVGVFATINALVRAVHDVACVNVRVGWGDRSGSLVSSAVGKRGKRQHAGEEKSMAA